MTESCSTPVTPIGFTASLSHTKASESTNGTFGYTNRQTVIFDSVITNMGDAYDPYTGIFSCQVTGVYVMMISLTSRANTDARLALTSVGAEPRNEYARCLFHQTNVIFWLLTYAVSD